MPFLVYQDDNLLIFGILMGVGTIWLCSLQSNTTMKKLSLKRNHSNYSGKSFNSVYSFDRCKSNEYEKI